MTRSIAAIGILQDVVPAPPSPDRDVVYSSWLAAVRIPDYDEIPPNMADRFPRLTDPALATLRFLRPCVPAVTTYLPMPAAKNPTILPVNVWDLFITPEAGHENLRKTLHTAFLISAQHRASMEHGEQAPRLVGDDDVLVLGSHWLKEEFRHFAWEAPDDWDGRAVLCDFTETASHRLQAPFFRAYLAIYPDKEILGFLCEGSQCKGELELQTMVAPPLRSLGAGVHFVNQAALFSEELG